MSEKKDIVESLNFLRRVIKNSFRHKWNVHSSVGGKYGELYVVNKLYKHGTGIGHQNKKRRSADIILKNKKRIEVKWGMIHDEDNNTNLYNRYDFKNFWGWNFSQGTQFLGKNHFDYCVLLAASKNDACPEHIFVLTAQEMKKYCKKRKGLARKEQYFIHVPQNDDKDFHKKKKNESNYIEKNLLKDTKYKKRWNELVDFGELKNAK